MIKHKRIGQKHSHQTLLDSGLSENTITGIMNAGLLRYERCKKPKCHNYSSGATCGMFFTEYPPSRWPKYWHNKWKQRIPTWRLKQSPWLKHSPWLKGSKAI